VTVRQGDDLSRPPVPVPVSGCPTCTELAILRDDARTWFNSSKETDANVLLRRHLRAEHDAPGPTGLPPELEPARVTRARP
jgi:hypothetical protein